jgi:hypothetical protein
MVFDKKAYYKEYYKKHKETIKAQATSFYKKNRKELIDKKRKWQKENREQVNKYHKEWRDKNREKYRENSRKYYKKNSKKILEYRRKWMETRPFIEFLSHGKVRKLYLSKQAVKEYEKIKKKLSLPPVAEKVRCYDERAARKMRREIERRHKDERSKSTKRE